MDFSQFDTKAGADAGFELELRHLKTNKPLGVFITIHGEDSAVYEKAVIDRHRRWADMAKKLPPDSQLPDEEAVKGTVDLLLATTHGWRNLEWNAVPVDAKNAAEFYTQFKWVRDQIAAAIHDRANFLPASSKK